MQDTGHLTHKQTYNIIVLLCRLYENVLLAKRFILEKNLGLLHITLCLATRPALQGHVDISVPSVDCELTD